MEGFRLGSGKRIGGGGYSVFYDISLDILGLNIFMLDGGLELREPRAPLCREEVRMPLSDELSRLRNSGGPRYCDVFGSPETFEADRDLAGIVQGTCGGMMPNSLKEPVDDDRCGIPGGTKNAGVRMPVAFMFVGA